MDRLKLVPASAECPLGCIFHIDYHWRRRLQQHGNLHTTATSFVPLLAGLEMHIGCGMSDPRIWHRMSIKTMLYLAAIDYPATTHFDNKYVYNYLTVTYPPLSIL